MELPAGKAQMPQATHHQDLKSHEWRSRFPLSVQVSWAMKPWAFSGEEKSWAIWKLEQLTSWILRTDCSYYLHRGLSASVTGSWVSWVSCWWQNHLISSQGLMVPAVGTAPLSSREEAQGLARWWPCIFILRPVGAHAPWGRKRPSGVACGIFISRS